MQGEYHCQRNGSAAETDTVHCPEEGKKREEEKKMKKQHHLSPLGGWSKEQAGLAAGRSFITRNLLFSCGFLWKTEVGAVTDCRNAGCCVFV